MKLKFLTAIMLITISLSFMGCTTNDMEALPKDLPKDDVFSDVYSYVDPETGVNYLIYNDYHAAGITVRLNADGTPYVTPVNEISEE